MRVGVGLHKPEPGGKGCGGGGGGLGGIIPKGPEAAAAAANNPGYGNWPEAAAACKTYAANTGSPQGQDKVIFCLLSFILRF